MKKSIKSRLVCIISFCLVTIMTFSLLSLDFVRFNAVDTSSSAEQDLKDKISALQSEQDTLAAQIASAEADQQSYAAQKTYLDSLVKSTQDEINATNELIAQYNDQIASKQVEIEEKQSVIDTKYELILDRLRFAYEEGSVPYIELLFSSDSLTDFLENTERVGNMLDFDKSVMYDLNTQLSELEAVKIDLANAQNDQKVLKENLVTKEADLDQQKLEVENYITQLAANEVAYEQQLKEAKAAEQEANAAVEKLLQERARLSATSSTQDVYVGDGSFWWPLSTSFTTISSPYGYRGSEFHLGIDIPASYGSPVHASAGGTVVTAQYHYSYGYYVLIDHGGGYATLYAHNSSLAVSAGQTVTQGQVISYVGSTGNSTGNHCHFEFRIGGSTVNPLSYVAIP